MKTCTVFLGAALAASLLVGQTDDERQRFREIQARHARGEQISADDMAFVQRMQALQQRQRESWAKDHPARETTGLIPLTDMGKGTYQGEEGGLYPGGQNTVPAAHLKSGMGISQSIRPLDGEGRPALEGRIVLLSIGMSNTTQEFQV